MQNIDLKGVIFENVHKMISMGLHGGPFVSQEKEPVILETWYEALVDSGFGDKDAKKIAKCWRAMRRTADKPFYPKHLIDSIRSMPSGYKTAAIEHRSDEVNLEGLKRINQMMLSTGLRIAK